MPRHQTSKIASQEQPQTTAPFPAREFFALILLLLAVFMTSWGSYHQWGFGGAAIVIGIWALLAGVVLGTVNN